MKKIVNSAFAFMVASLWSTVSAAQTGTLAFQGVKIGECQSIRVFGENSNGDFLFMTADISSKSDDYTASDLVTKSFPAGKIILERVACFSRKNKNIFSTPVPGGILSDPYVGLKSPLAVIDLKAGETVYLGALELHKLGWGAGLIAHDLSKKVATPAGTRTSLLEVSYDIEKSLGNAEKLEQLGDEASRLLAIVSEGQAPAPSDDGKGEIGLYFKSDDLDCNSVEVLFGREHKGKIIKEKTMRFKVAKMSSQSTENFNRETFKSGRKHLLDITCKADSAQFSLVPRNQYGRPKFDWESKGQFDLSSDSQVFLGTLTFTAKPIGDISEEMAKKLGFYEVNLNTDLEAQAAPVEFANAKAVKMTEIQRVLKDQTRRANFNTVSAKKFQSDLKSFLQIKAEREIEGPNL